MEISPASLASYYFHHRDTYSMFSLVKFLQFLVFALLGTGHVRSKSAEQALNFANSAMDSGLWDVAASTLMEAAEDPDLSVVNRSKVLMLLAESFVRGNQSTRAFELLGESSIRDLPDSAFWRGQALAGLGRFAEAADTLRAVAADPSNRFSHEAALTAASLQLSLSLPESALKTLALIERSADPTQRTLSVLRRMEILIDLGRAEDARNLSPEPESISEDLRPTFSFLDAKLALAEGNATEAEALFSSLLTDPQGQTISHYNHAALGKADALAAQGKEDAATEFLLTFIQGHPDTPMLDPMFGRIIKWFPEEIIAADHPTLLRLNEWIPQTPPFSNRLINIRADSAAAAWPIKSPEISDLGVFALYARALGLQRIDSQIAKDEARLLLQRIRLLASNHFLAPRALLVLAKSRLADGEADQAFTLFDTLRQTANSPLISGEAAFMDAQIAFDKGKTELAASLFEEAATRLSGENRDTALLNSALAQLSENPSQTLLIKTDDPDTRSRLTTELALEKALVNPDPAESRIALDNFLTKNPEHSRAVEARLAIVEAALSSNPPDLLQAKAQLDTLKASEKPLPTDQAPRLAIAELRLLAAQDEIEPTVALAKEITTLFPDTSYASDARLIMGNSLFRSGNYNEARLVLEKLASANEGTQRSQAALLLAARSAALGATAQSREESLALFDRTIAIDGPLRALAILEKARLNIDLNRLSVAVDSLSEAYQSAAPDDPSRLPTGLLLAEAIYAQGDSDPENLVRALKIYDELIALTANNPAQYFRLNYLRGLALEKIPNPEKPGETRVGDALSAYFSVLDRPVDPAPPEWEWFERSGFRALSLLENASRWNAAVSIAEKIASFQGPRAEEAATRARQIRLKHHIWED